MKRVEPKNLSKKVVIGKIIKISKHPNADVAKLVKVDIGQDKTLMIVCGGTNIAEGHIIAVALPGSQVNLPSGKVIDVKKMDVRGEESEGIICSTLELGAGDEYEDEWILPSKLEKYLGEPLVNHLSEVEIRVLKRPKVPEKVIPEIKEEDIRKKLFKINRDSFDYKLAKLIYKAAVEVVGKRKVKLREIKFEHPANLEHGDYSTNLALQIKTDKYPNPWDLANEIVNTWRVQGLPDFVAQIKVEKPGFINIWLKNEVFSKELERVLMQKGKYGTAKILKGKKLLLEHTSPNPQTTIMLGHLRNNFLGMSAANLFEFLGAKVTRDCIVNDRGVHICRSIWGYLILARKRTGLKKKELLNFRKVSDSKLKKAIKEAQWQESLRAWTKKKSDWWQPKDLGLKPDHANLIWYVLGSRAFKMDQTIKKQVKEILLAWEAGDKQTWQVWQQILDWSAKGYADTYQRIGSLHDYVWYESRLYKGGKEWVEKGLKKGVFKKSQGAIVSDLAEYGLPDTVLIKSDGAAVYHTFDLNFTLQKRKKFPSDLYIWDIGAEQTLYFKQLFAMCEQLGIGKREDYFHLNYALINFKGGGKMATREGSVVAADEILDRLHQRALEIIKNSNQELRGRLSSRQLEKLAETVAVGAVKYSLLKFSRETTIYFDIDESLALEGNSAPYLQYTSARCQSVLKKAPKVKKLNPSETTLNEEELALLRMIYQFSEVVQEAAENFAPNLVCNFLFDLAQKYNLFYNKHSILKAENEETKSSRLALTAAVSQILKNGLTLLGITTPERM